MTDPSSAHRVRLGDFHLDLDSGELVKDGVRVRLQVQSLELLKALLERPGKMIGREELRQRLWPEDTFVDFDHGLNAAVRRLREALGDSADAPRFVETIPRRGYRLVAETSGATPPGAAFPFDQPCASRATVPTSRARGIRTVRVLGPMAVLLLIGAAAAWLASERTASESRRPLVTLSLDVPTGWEMGTWDTIAVSPDGRHLAFTASGSDRQRALWLRPLAEPAARLVPRTAGAFAPFWSPDSTKLGFFVQGNLHVVHAADGALQGITRLENPQLTSGAATWTDNGDILLAPVGTTSGSILRSPGLYRLARQTGRVDAIPSFRTDRELAFLWPSAVPGRDLFTFLTLNTRTHDLSGHTGSVSPGHSVADIGETDSRIVATSSGHILFVRNGTLVAQRLDARGQLVASQPTILARDVSVELPTLGLFSASSDVLVYLTRSMLPGDMQITLFDRSGAVVGSLGDRGVYSSLAISPDGTRVAVGRRNGPTGTRDIWIYDLTGTPPVRLTFDPHDDMAPKWSADGKTILFSSDRSGERDIYQKAAVGQRPETLIFSSSESKSLNAWSPDGKVLIYDTGARGGRDAQGRTSLADLFFVSLEGTPRVRPLATSSAYEATADISPDGTLVAYQSSEAGALEVFVETFPEKAGRWQVTTAGGREPVWAADGRELFYISAVNELCAVDVSRNSGDVRFGPQRVLFKIDGLANTTRKFGPLPGRRGFVVLTTKPHTTPQQMTVIVNWRARLIE